MLATARAISISTIHITEYADPIKHSPDDTSKLGFDFNYNGSVFGSETEVKFLHSVGSFGNNRFVEHSGCTSDRDLGICIELCTAEDGSDYTAQKSDATVHCIEWELLHRSPHSARIGFNSNPDKICFNGTRMQATMFYEKHHYSELLVAHQAYSEAVEILDYDLSEAKVTVSESLSSIDKQVNELGSSVAVIELK